MPSLITGQLQTVSLQADFCSVASGCATFELPRSTPRTDGQPYVDAEAPSKSPGVERRVRGARLGRRQRQRSVRQFVSLTVASEPSMDDVPVARSRRSKSSKSAVTAARSRYLYVGATIQADTFADSKPSRTAATLSCRSRTRRRRRRRVRRQGCLPQ